MTSSIQRIEEALQQNKDIPSALLGKRVFERTQKDGTKELLSLVYTDVRDPLVWGHVLKTDEGYVALLVGFETWFNAMNSDKVFERFWHHLTYFGDWYPLDSRDAQGDEVYREYRSYEEAIEGLREMIEGFDIEKVASEDSEIYLTDYRVMGIYPFADCHATLPSYPK